MVHQRIIFAMPNNSYLYKDVVNDADLVTYLTGLLKSESLSNLPGLEEESKILSEQTRSIANKLGRGEVLTRDEAASLSEMVRNLINLNFAPHTSPDNTKGLENYRDSLKRKFNL
jgi:hypothetical protein